MGVLEQVTDMKGRGLSESQIVGDLREQGFSPREINDALGQSRIKSAVSSSKSPGNKMEPSMMGSPDGFKGEDVGDRPSGSGGYVPDEDLSPPPSYSKIPPAAQRNFGRMTKEFSGNGQQEQTQDEYVPHPGDQPQYPPSFQQYQQPYPEPQDYGYEQQQPQEYYSSMNYEYQPQAYSPMQQSAGAVDSDTTIEIAEQVFSEKSKDIQKNIDDLTEISTLIQSKIESFSDRLKRIEATIDRLQSDVLEKVGSYGSNLDSIKKEMSMMQDSFGKIVGRALDHAEHHTHSASLTTKRASRKR